VKPVTLEILESVDTEAHPKVSRTEWQAATDELSSALSRGEITDEQWFSGMSALFDAAYVAVDDPRAQSGFGGDESRWEAGRRPIVKAIDRDGTFLDVGCANGYLMECVVRWAPHDIEPYYQFALVKRLLEDVVARRGRLIICGYGSPRSGLVAHPVGRIVRSYGLEPELEFDAEAPEGGGPILEVAVVRSV
jgi:hypothetical protein